MLEHTKMLHTKSRVEDFSGAVKANQKDSWRHVFKGLIETHSSQGLYLKGLRLREGYTQAALGKLIGVHENNISAMERGKRVIGKDIAQRLAEVFHVKYQKFL